MRPPPPSPLPRPVVVSKNQSEVYPTQSTSTATPTCSPNTCRWRPYASTNDFETNAILILIILFCALVSALALNAAIRCFLRSNGSNRSSSQRRQRSPADRLPRNNNQLQRKPSLQAAAAQLVLPPTLVYSAGLKLAAAEAECAICLSEFVEGDSIQVLGRCKHGFHVECIQQWLSSHYSCPTCRCSCLHDSPSMASTSISQLDASQTGS